MLSARNTNICFLELSENEKELTVSAGFKIWSRRLRQDGKQIQIEKDITNIQSEENKLVILPNPQKKFTIDEFEHLKRLLEHGTSVLILLNEQGEVSSKSNVNYLLEEFGISINTDSVIRTSFVHRYYHPKEALVHSDGILSSKFCKPCSFIYPYGASLNVQSPAVPLMTSSNVCYPANRPIAAYFGFENQSSGKLGVIGSVQIFGDKFIGKESNQQIADSMVSFLCNKKSNGMEMMNVEIPEYNLIPDTISLSDGLKSTLQEGENDFCESDVQQMFYDNSLYKLDNLLYAEIYSVYEKLGIPTNQLSLIKPNFETPLPQPKPGTFLPGFREPHDPEIELFDLDEALSCQQVRLAQVTNRCRPDEIYDLEYMLTMSGEALRINEQLQNKEPINILRFIFNTVRDYKMENQDC